MEAVNGSRVLGLRASGLGIKAATAKSMSTRVMVPELMVLGYYANCQY